MALGTNMTVLKLICHMLILSLFLLGTLLFGAVYGVLRYISSMQP